MDLNTNLTLTSTEAECVLALWLGEGVHCTGVERLRGGMINSVLRLSFDREPHTAVIKLNAGEQGFDEEARNLRYLHARGFPCPEVYLVSEPLIDNVRLPYTFLLLEMLPGVTLDEARMDTRNRARVERELAEVLADLHAHTRPTFGPIDAPGSERWIDSFIPRLYEVRQEPEVTRRLSAEVLRDVDMAIQMAPGLLEDQGEPTLIHGDIWSANVMVVEARDGWRLSGLVDPGAQYADVEMELAYLRVFHTVGEAFFDIYTAYSPLRLGYELRWPVYWLRTYLIHVWLFGDQHYRDMTALVAREIATNRKVNR
jgi:fructosamine-3-kinase